MIENKVKSLIEATINSMGYELVRVKQIGNDIQAVLTLGALT